MIKDTLKVILSETLRLGLQLARKKNMQEFLFSLIVKKIYDIRA